MKLFRTILVFLLASTPILSSGLLSPKAKGVIDAWLRQNPHYRLATDEDCQCPEDIELMRRGQGGAWKPAPDYHPFAIQGDFNSDGLQDFAVAVIDRSKAAKNFTLLVFNGPLRKDMQPAFKFEDLDLRHRGLFYGPPRQKPYRLILGPFEAEGQVLTPTNGSYKLTNNGL